jgi:hypothetical protein
MGTAYSTHGEMRSAYTILVAKPKVKRKLKRNWRVGRIILNWIFRK